MFGIGGFEFLIIIIFGFLIVGPERLPDIARTLGRALKTFQNARKEVSDVVKNDIYDPNAEDPFKDPLAAIDKVSDITKRTGSSLKSDFDKERARQKAAKKTASGATSHVDGGKSGSASAHDASKGGEAGHTETASGAGAAASAASAASAGAASTASASSAPTRTESFTERRARYERERAARLAAQAEEDAAKTQAAGEENAAGAANAATADASAATTQTAQETAKADSMATSSASQVTQEPQSQEGGE